MRLRVGDVSFREPTYDDLLEGFYCSVCTDLLSFNLLNIVGYKNGISIVLYFEAKYRHSIRMPCLSIHGLVTACVVCISKRMRA